MPQAKRIPIAEPGRSAILDANVLQFVRDAIGDPRLTWWEANFVNGMANWVAPTGPGAHLLTEKQWAVIGQISTKLEAVPAEDVPDAPDLELTVEADAPLTEPVFVDEGRTLAGKVAGFARAASIANPPSVTNVLPSLSCSVRCHVGAVLPGADGTSEGF